MNLMIKKRSLILKQVFCFVILSPLYLIALQALSSGYSPIDGQLLYNFLLTKFLTIPLFCLCAWGVWQARSWSSRMLVFFVLVMAAVQINVYLSYQDKTVLFLLFFYLLSSLSMVALWGVEFSRVVYHPGFHHLDLGKKSAYPIPVTFSLCPQNPEKKIQGYLSNWDSTNCYIVSEEKLEFESRDTIVELEVTLEGYFFIGRGMLVTQYGQALGVSFLEDIASFSDSASWSDFYGIMSERAIIHTI